MEGGSSAVGSRGAGGDLCTAQEPRGEKEVEAGDVAMRARVCARVRTPQGVGALLLIGGAIVGGAVVAWRRRRACRHDDGKDAKNHHREQPVKEEVLDGGVVEDEQSGASARKFDQSDENFSRDNTEVGANGPYGKATEELDQIQKENEIVEDELDSKPADEVCQNSSRNLADISMSDTFWLQDSGIVEKVDKNSSKNDVENEVTPNALDTEGVENSDQSTLSISNQEITHEEHNNNDDGGAQDTESTETTPTAQMMTHQEQLSEEVKTDTVTETAEAKLPEGTIMEKNVFEQEEEKALAELVGLVGSPAYSSLSSLLKPTDKKGPETPGWNETGMKLEQDIANGELSRGGATQGVAVVTMDHRAASMAILALMFAVTIGIAVVMRLYSPLQAT